MTALHWGMIAVLLPSMAAAQGDRWTMATWAALHRADTLAASRGYTATPVRLSGSLFIDESETRELPLPAEGRYLVVATCDEDCHTLNMVLSNPSHDEVAADRSERSSPLVEVRAAKAGVYRVKLIMGACRRAPCRYGIAVYRKL